MAGSARPRWRRPWMAVVLLAGLALVVVVTAVGMTGPQPVTPEIAADGAGVADPPDPGPSDTDAVEPDPDPVAGDPTPTSDPASASVPASDPDPADRDLAPQDPDGRRTLTIHHVGDVNLDPRQMAPAAAGDPAFAWEGARDTFAEADLVIVNLECAATEGGAPLDKQFLFRCDLDLLPGMREAGVGVANLANNHTGDYGVPGIVDSLRNVEAAGIVGVGVGADEDEAYRPRIVEVAGWRVAILGFGGVVPTPDWTARGDSPGQATGYDPTRMAAAVEVAAADADLVVVTVHWGTEGSFEPRPEDRVKTDAMIAAGADVVFGHHAHRLQPLERVGEVPVFWNLGNFVWPNRSEEASRTAVAEFVVEPDGTTRSCLRPFRIDANGVPRPTGDAPTCA